MLDGLRPYPQYKPSGLPWLDSIPNSWRIVRNGSLFAQRNQTGYGDLPILEVSLRTGVRVRDLDSGARKQIMSDREKYKRACAGDIAYNMMRMWQGAVGAVPQDGLVSPAYVVALPLPGAHSLYFAHLYRTDAYMGEVDKYSHGIVKDRNRLYWDDFKQMPSPCPPPDEQAAIVRFLHRVDQRIADYMRAKQKLIALLNEQKLAIIHRAVTRGLDPNVRLKPSDVEWLGEVPEHWEVVALRHRYSVDLGKMLDTKRITGECLVPYLRNTDVQWDRINTASLPLIDIRPHEHARYTVRAGDLLVCEGGEVGRAAIWDGLPAPCGYQKALHRLRPLSVGRDRARFLWFVLFNLAKRGVFQARGSENTIAHLTGEKLRRFRLAFPPPGEQTEIIGFLDHETAKLNDAKASVERDIRLVREYRVRLIVDIVMGKLDVREAVESLPVEDDALTWIDQADMLADSDVPDDVANDDPGDEEALAEIAGQMPPRRP